MTPYQRQVGAHSFESRSWLAAALTLVLILLGLPETAGHELEEPSALTPRR